MKVKNIGANKTVIELENGNQVFISYETPVAAFISGRGYIKTDKSWSVTTSKHITQWAGMKITQTEPQAFFLTISLKGNNSKQIHCTFS